MLPRFFSRFLTLGLLACAVSCSDPARPTFRGSSCQSAADCDDGVACTTDVCSVGGACQHISNGCADASAPRTCRSSTDCDDGRACTTDVCAVGGVCEYVSSGCPAGGTVAPRTCRATADCNDNIACTRDSCSVDMLCRNTPQNEMCPSGQTCDPASGCTSGMVTPPGMCRAPTDCDDRIDCTENQCSVMNTCVFVPQNARCPTGQTCFAGMGCVAARACSTNADCDDRMRCNGVEMCSETGCRGGTPVNCDDSDACTVDACVETGATMCTHTRDMSCMTSMIRSGFYDVTPAVSYACTDKIFGMDVVRLNITAFQFVLSGSSLTVNGAPAPMTGTAPSGGMFRVTGVVAGTCRETYTLEGRFTDATHFTGTFSIAFQGFDCSLSNCETQMRSVMGTARM